MIYLGLAMALVVVIVTLGVAVRRSYRRWARRRQWSRAQQAETAAFRRLRNLGYDILGAQVPASYELLVDGQPTTISLRADYVVERHGKTYVAEVKSGQWAPSLANAATRRQLLEYRLAFRVDGVLLVDGETRRVHQIVFPSQSQSPSAAWSGRRLGVLALGLIIAATLWILGRR